MSSVFNWITNDANLDGGRILVSFASVTQRTQFLKDLTLPPGMSYSLGNLEKL